MVLSGLRARVRSRVALLAIACALTAIWVGAAETDLLTAASNGDLARVKALLNAKARAIRSNVRASRAMRANR